MLPKTPKTSWPAAARFNPGSESSTVNGSTSLPGVPTATAASTTTTSTTTPPPRGLPPPTSELALLYHASGVAQALTSSSPSKNFSPIHRRRASTDSLSVWYTFLHTRGVRGEGEAAASGRSAPERGRTVGGGPPRAGVAGSAGGSSVQRGWSVCQDKHQ